MTLNIFIPSEVTKIQRCEISCASERIEKFSNVRMNALLNCKIVQLCQEYFGVSWEVRPVVNLRKELTIRNISENNFLGLQHNK